jgi:conjugative transfer signal peptidase TraF
MPDRRNVPLLSWATELRRARQARRRLRIRLAIGAAGVALVGLTIIEKPLPRLVWNVSASAPVGLYHITPGTPLDAGDMVVARTPAAVRELAAKRHYLPSNVPLVKRVSALPGDYVCAIGEQVYVNGTRAAARLTSDRMGRPLPWWTGCGVLARGEYLLLMDPLGSFDGRYFGPVGEREIIGKAVPLWVR